MNAGVNSMSVRLRVARVVSVGAAASKPCDGNDGVGLGVLPVCWR